MILSRIDDPRDSLERADRDELWRFAMSKGIKEVDQRMPAILMRKILRRHGATDIPVNWQLGMPRGASPPAVPSGKPPVMVDDIYADWKPPEPDPVPPSVDPSWAAELPMGKLKAYAKAHGIKQSRTDTRETLLAKINGQSHAA